MEDLVAHGYDPSHGGVADDHVQRSSSTALVAHRRRSPAARACFLLIVAIRGLTPKPRPSRPAETRGRTDRRTCSARAARSPSCVGVLVLLVTRWPVAGVGIGLLVFVWDSSLGGAAPRNGARWPGSRRWPPGPSRCGTRSPARSASSRRSPRRCGPRHPRLEPHVRRLVDRLHTRMPLPDALRGFADDLDDPSRRPDRRRARPQRPAARSRPARDARRAGRLGPRGARHAPPGRGRAAGPPGAACRSWSAVSVGIALVLAIFNPTYLQPYNSFIGELVLAVVVALCSRSASSGCAGWRGTTCRSASWPAREPARPPRCPPRTAPGIGSGRRSGPTGERGGVSLVSDIAIIAGAIARHWAGLPAVPCAVPAPASGLVRAARRLRRGAAGAGDGRQPGPGTAPPSGSGLRPGWALARGLLRRARLGVALRAGRSRPGRQVLRGVPGHQGPAGRGGACRRPAGRSATSGYSGSHVLDHHPGLARPHLRRHLLLPARPAAAPGGRGRSGATSGTPSAPSWTWWR